MHDGVVCGDAINRQIAARQRRRGLPPFRFGDGAQDRDPTFVGEVDADAEIDPVRIAIAVEGLVGPSVGSRGAMGTPANSEVLIGSLLFSINQNVSTAP